MTSMLSVSNYQDGWTDSSNREKFLLDIVSPGIILKGLGVYSKTLLAFINALI